MPVASSMEERIRDDTAITAKDRPKVHSKKVISKKKEERVIKDTDAKSIKNIILSKIFILKNSLYLIISIRSSYVMVTFASTNRFFSKKLQGKYSQTS